eukprot:COSAG06_NODE_6494_length_2909_cov_6.102491_4_plen_308_part_00
MEILCPQQRVPLAAAAARAGRVARRAVAVPLAPVVQPDQALQSAHEHGELRCREEQRGEVRLRHRAVQRTEQREEVDRGEGALGARGAGERESGRAGPYRKRSDGEDRAQREEQREEVRLLQDAREEAEGQRDQPARREQQRDEVQRARPLKGSPLPDRHRAHLLALAAAAAPAAGAAHAHAASGRCLRQASADHLHGASTAAGCEHAAVDAATAACYRCGRARRAVWCSMRGANGGSGAAIASAAHSCPAKNIAPPSHRWYWDRSGLAAVEDGAAESSRGAPARMDAPVVGVYLLLKHGHQKLPLV